MTIGERIKKLRKAKSLTQQSFADKLDLKRQTIAAYEVGTVTPSDRTVRDICNKFHVSETWLRKGEGDMDQPTPSNTLDALAQEYQLDSFGRAVVEKMVNLDEKQWEVLQRAVVDIVSSLAEETEEPVAPAFATGQTEPATSEQEQAHNAYEAEARAKAERLYQELLSKKGQTERRLV